MRDKNKSKHGPATTHSFVVDNISIPVSSQFMVNEPPAPREPSVMHRAKEILGYLALTEQNVAEMDTELFGAQSEGDAPPTPKSLEGMLADLSTRLACLCGRTATMKAKLGE